MFYPILRDGEVVSYKLYPKPENLIDWYKNTCPKCPYYYKNWENSTQCRGTMFIIKKKCVFNQNN